MFTTHPNTTTCIVNNIYSCALIYGFCDFYKCGLVMMPISYNVLCNDPSLASFYKCGLVMMPISYNVLCNDPSLGSLHGHMAGRNRSRVIFI